MELQQAEFKRSTRSALLTHSVCIAFVVEFRGSAVEKRALPLAFQIIEATVLPREFTPARSTGAHAIQKSIDRLVQVLQSVGCLLWPSQILRGNRLS